MKDINFNTLSNRPRILLAPLDWGLGHATRCIPIILKLQQQNCEVIIAAETGIKFLLEKEFPNLIFIHLAGYRIRYSYSKFCLPLRLVLQFPKLLYRVYVEKIWLNNVIKTHHIDGVISDNRFGLSNKNIPCAYITHQIKIKTNYRLTEYIIQKIHYHFINKYNTCWVPDNEGKLNFAGELSHPAVLPKTSVKYIGPLSRFEKNETEIKYDLCIILSGPEPQRSLFEKIILQQLKIFNGSVFIVRGLPGNLHQIELKSTNIEIKNHLPTSELNTVLLQSKMIISRSGYTTVMDLIKLQKRAILVPTPGQTEQEYLARYLHDNKIFYSAPQHNFSLLDELKKAMQFCFKKTTCSLKDYENVISKFIFVLKNNNNKNI